MGSPDGVSVFPYKKGGEYDLPDALARIFIAEGWAKAVGSRSKLNRKKDLGQAPENKTKTKAKK